MTGRTCGTTGAYDAGCRCRPCRNAKSDYAAARKQGVHRIDREALTDLLRELFPDGMTDECPARRSKVAA